MRGECKGSGARVYNIPKILMQQPLIIIGILRILKRTFKLNLTFLQLAVKLYTIYNFFDWTAIYMPM